MAQPIVVLTPSEVMALQAMIPTWEDIAQRDDMDRVTTLSFDELNKVLGIIRAVDLLLMVGEYVKNYK